MSLLGDPILVLTLRASLALLLGTAAVHKGRDLSTFRYALAAYALLPSWSVPMVALGLAAAEALVAVALLVPGSGRLASLAAAALLLLYAGAMAVNLGRGRTDLDCGCFGPGQPHSVSSRLVWRNLFLAAVAIWATLPIVGRASTWVDGITLVAAVATSSFLYRAAETLMANRSQGVAERAHA